MICKICNIPISDNALFCPVCGTETGRTVVNKEFTGKAPSPLPLPTGQAGSPSRGEGHNISLPLRGGDKGEGDDALMRNKPETKKCLQCGAENPFNAKFCRVDGWSFPEEAVNIPSPVEQAGEEMIKCPECGTLNPVTARFCRVDGSLLKPDNVTEKKIEDKKIEEKKVEDKKIDTSVESEKPVKAPEENVKGLRNKKLWIYLAALLIFSFVVAYWLFSGPVTNKKSPTTSGDTEEVQPAKQTTTQNNEPVKKKNEPQPDRRTETKDREHEKGVDLARLEGQINRALRIQDLEGVTAEVDDSAIVTLKGVVNNDRDKKKAFEIAKSFRDVRQVKDIIFVVER